MCSLLALVVLGGHAWAAAQPGSYLYTYTSAIDKSVQPYVVYVPNPYAASVAHPVVFCGHGFNSSSGPPTVGGQYFSAYQMSFADANGFLLVYHYGRGNTFYDGVGETDFFDVLKAMRGNFLLDDNRLYYEGASMGATGAYRFGVRHPDVLAAVGGCDGWCNYRYWVPHYYSPAALPTFIDPTRVPNLDANSPIDIAENAKWQHLLMIVDTADNTVDSAESFSMATQLAALGKKTTETDYQYTLIPNWGGGHCDGYNQQTIYSYLQGQRKTAYPRHIVIKTARLKYGALYWASIDRLQQINTFGTLDATITGNRVEVTTGNLLQYTLNLDANLLDARKPVTIATNGTVCYTGPAGSITLYAALNLNGGITGWSTTDTLPGGLHKTATLEGPIGAAYTTPFIVVYGNGIDQAEADSFCLRWNGWMGANITSRAASTVTGADLAAYNLILFGTIDSNSLIRAMQPSLPIQVTQNAVLIAGRQYSGLQYGCYFVYPNPLNPAKLAVFSHRTMPGTAPKDMEALPWYWPDYVIFDTTRIVGYVNNQTPSKLLYLPDCFVEAGYFDGYWQLGAARRQPDLWIRAAADTSDLGNDIYNDDGAGQTSEQPAKPGSTAGYIVTAQNDGSVNDTLLVTGSAASAGWTVSYLDAQTGKDVTAQVTGSGWSSGPLPPGGLARLKVQVTPTQAAWKATLRVPLTAVSLADNTQNDTVAALTTVAYTYQPQLWYLIGNTAPRLQPISSMPPSTALAVPNGTAANYLFHLVNAGNTGDTFTVTGTKAGTGWTVSYREATSGKDITTAMTGNGWSSGVLPPAAQACWWAQVTPGATPAAGTLQGLLLTAISAGNANGSASATCLVTVAATYRPDLSLHNNGETAYTGAGIFNLDGRGQSKAQTVAAGVPANYYFRVQNAGNTTDSYTLNGTGGNSTWLVRYFNGATNTEITAQITGAGLGTIPLIPGAALTLWAQVTPRFVTTIPPYTLRLNAVSTTDKTQQDVVKAVTTRR